MKDSLTIIAVCLSVIGFAACGSPSAPPVPDWLHDPHLTVAYAVTPDAVTCSNRPSPMAAADYPNGWWCHWRCGWVDADHVSQVWLALHKDSAGKWDPATVERYDSRCYSEAECPTCATE